MIINGSGLQAHAPLKFRGRMRGSGARSRRSSTFPLQVAVRNDGAVGREGEEGRSSALCTPPAQLVSVEAVDWCICPGMSPCEGSGCAVDKWDPEKVMFFTLLFFIKGGVTKLSPYINALPTFILRWHARTRCSTMLAARTPRKSIV